MVEVQSRAHEQRLGAQREREHTNNKTGKPKRESTQRTTGANQKERAHKEQQGRTKKREYTKNKSAKPKRESTQRTRGANLGVVEVQSRAPVKIWCAHK